MQNRLKKTFNGGDIKRTLKRALKYLKNNTELLRQKQGSTEDLVFETLKKFLGEVSDDLRVFHDAEAVKEWREKFDTQALSNAEAGAIALVYEPNGSQGNPDFWVAWNYRYLSFTVKSTKNGTVKWNSGLPEGEDVCISARTKEDKSLPCGRLEVLSSTYSRSRSSLMVYKRKPSGLPEGRRPPQ